MTNVLYPYATLVDGEPVLTVAAVRLDDTSRPQFIKKEDSTIHIYEDPKRWKKAEIDLELTCSSGPIQEFEDSHGPLSPILVAHCLSTNVRQQLLLTRSEVELGRWSGTLELDRDSVSDRIFLESTFAATIDGIPNRPVATTPRWTIYADEPRSLSLKGNLKVRWLDFKKTEESPAKEFPKCTHVVAFNSGVPELWLNSGFEGLEPLLKDRKDRRGAEKGVHDVLRTGIARSVWLTLIADALSAVREESAANETMPDWPEKPWQAEVLKLVLYDVAPGKSEIELLSMASKEWRESPGSGEFFARAEAVVGDIVRSNELLRRFVQNYHGDE